MTLWRGLTAVVSTLVEAAGDRFTARCLATLEADLASMKDGWI